jgi:hypothetical protein
MHIYIDFVLPVQNKAEAQIKLQELKQALSDAQIQPERVDIAITDRQTIEYSEIPVTEK